jgi:glycosyltransferase involved in cell wall biosynthesis
VLTALRARHEVTLVTVAGDEPGELEAALELQRTTPGVHVVDRRRPAGPARHRRRLRLAATWLRGAYPWRTVWFADPQVQRTIDELVRAHAFDAIAVQDNSMGVFRLPPGVPRLLTEHEVQDPGPPARRLGRPGRMLRDADRRRWQRFQPAVWRRFDLIEVFSDRDAARIAEMAPELRDRVRVNPFATAPPDPVDPARQQDGVVLFVGNYTHPPNVDAALWLAREIVPLVREQVAGARLVLVGPAAPDELLELSLPFVELAGEVPALRPWLESAAVVAAPVRLGGGMRMKVLAALAAGKAVVTTPRGAEGLRLDEDEPPLVVAEGARELAGAIAALLQDRPRRLALGERARAFAAEHHGLEAYAERLDRLYRELAAAGGRR